MEFEETYNPLGMQIEGNIQRGFENTFKKLKQANSPEQSLESIKVMFDYLGKSRSNQGKRMDWSRDLIEAYRTLGKIFDGVYSEFEAKLKKFEKEEVMQTLGELEKEVEDLEGGFD